MPVNHPASPSRAERSLRAQLAVGRIYMVEQTDQRTQASAGQVIRSSAGIEHFVQNQRTAFCRLGDAGTTTEGRR